MLSRRELIGKAAVGAGAAALTLGAARAAVATKGATAVDTPTGKLPTDPSAILPGDPAGKLPGDPAGRVPGDPLGMVPSDPASKLPSDPSVILPENRDDLAFADRQLLVRNARRLHDVADEGEHRLEIVRQTGADQRKQVPRH